jgi:single-stranded DNA-specific DHH superfamily exonuclease
VVEEKVHDLASGLEGAFALLGEAAIIRQPYEVDMELGLDDFSSHLLRAQRACAPFGCENNKPLYLVRNVQPKEVVAFGKAKEHTKLTFATRGVVKEAIAFFRTPEQFDVTPSPDTPLSMLVHLEESFFMNRLQTRLRIVELF